MRPDFRSRSPPESHDQVHQNPQHELPRSKITPNNDTARCFLSQFLFHSRFPLAFAVTAQKDGQKTNHTITAWSLFTLPLIENSTWADPPPPKKNRALINKKKTTPRKGRMNNTVWWIFLPFSHNRKRWAVRLSRHHTIIVKWRVFFLPHGKTVSRELFS